MAGASKPIGSAVIGYGATHNFGWMHAQWMPESPYLNLLAICDRDKGRTGQAKEDFPGVRVYNSPNSPLKNRFSGAPRTPGGVGRRCRS